MTSLNGFLRIGASAAAALATFTLALGAHAEAPATAKVLAQAPKEAQVAVALPAISESLTYFVDFAKKVAPQANIDAELAKVVADVAADAGAAGATSLPDVALARGLDPAQPIGAFFDFSNSVASAAAAQKGDDAGEQAGDPAAAAPAAADAPKPEAPKWVAVIGVTDAAKAEAFITELGEKMPDLPAREEVEKGGQKVFVRGDYAHYITDKQAVIGNKDLVLATAEKSASTTAVRYGSKDLPANEHEAVALIYGDRFFPLVEKILPSLEMDEVGRQLATVQLEKFKTAFASGSGEEDPLVVTLSVGADRADLRTHLDTAKHPGYLEMTGPANPLRLAPMLPENTLALLSLRLNEQMKKEITEQVIPAVQQAGQDAAVYAAPAVQMIGDEITLGIAAVENDFPAAYLMISLQEPEAAKGMLSMLVPTMPAETYNEEEIKTIAAPIPVPLAMATPGDILIISNNMDGMKKIIDLQKSKGTTKLLASLKDPMKPETPRYQALMLKSALLSDVVVPLSALAGGLPPDVAPVVTSITGSVDEIRFASEMQDTWSVNQFTTYLK